MEALAKLPPNVQSELYLLVRAVAGMSTDEKHTALAALNGVCEAYVEHGDPRQMPAVQVLGRLGGLIGSIHTAPTPNPRTKETP